MMLWVKDRPGANVVFRGARVLDPGEGIDAMLDVRIDDGVILANHFAAKLLKLTISAVLRTVMAKHWAAIPKLHRLGKIQHAVRDVRTHHGSRSLRTKR